MYADYHLTSHRASRRNFAALLTGLLLCLIASAAAARALEVKGIALTVSDLDRSVAFYETALDFRKLSERVVAGPDQGDLDGVSGGEVKVAVLQLGDETIELEQYLTPPGRPIPADSRSNDLWFQHFAVVVSDMKRAYAHLPPHRSISGTPQTIPASNVAAAGIKAYKFKDPDGHPLELIYFPPGKGRPRWRNHGERLFLGIDHSAITVASSEKSAAFYRDLLGLSVAGEGVNTGPTQERLDHAAGAVVRITGLRPESADGPGIEFLQYVRPADGRAATEPVRANDVAHVHTVLQVDNLADLAERLGKQGAAFISPQIIELDQHGKSLMVRDPDGHAVLLVEQ